jgi:glycosyltransferase involved in cell wall biosynthesis
MRRIVIFAPHYAEYSTRLAIALSKQAKVMLILDISNRQNECDLRLMHEARLKLEIVEFGSQGRKQRIFSLIKIIISILKFRPHIVNIQEEEGSFAIWVTRIIARLYPVLLTVHDPVPHTGTDLDFVTKNLSNRTKTRSLAKAFLVHGAYCYKQLVNQIGNEKPILSVPHGVILVPQASELCLSEPHNILFFGRMEAYKGLEILLDAADILRQRGIKFYLTLAGRGPELARLSHRISAHEDIKRIDQFLPPSEAIEQFQKCLCVVLPYLNATQSGVAAAAFANGRCIIASNTGGLTEIVHDNINGLIVESGHALQLADAIQKILTHSKLAVKLSAGARQFASENLEWESIAKRFLEFDTQQVSCYKNLS